MRPLAHGGVLVQRQQAVAHLRHHIGVFRLLLHGAGSAAQVHQDEAGSGSGGDAGHVRIVLQAGDVIDDIGPRFHRRRRHPGLHGIDGNRHPALGPQPGDDRQDAPQFLLRFHRRGPRPCALAADIQDVRAGRGKGLKLHDIPYAEAVRIYHEETQQALPLSEVAYQTLRAPRTARIVEAANASARAYHLSGAARSIAHTNTLPDGTQIPQIVIYSQGVGSNVDALGKDGFMDGFSEWLNRMLGGLLIGLIEREAGINILLTRRSDRLRSHTGQVALPGGRQDPGERPVDTALREAHEEVGLDPRFVRPVGLSTPYQTGTGFLITPVVGFVSHGFTLSKTVTRAISVAMPITMPGIMMAM